MGSFDNKVHSKNGLKHGQYSTQYSIYNVYNIKYTITLHAALWPDLAAMASRGGPRRGPVPSIGARALSDVFDDFAKERQCPFDFGIYEHLTRSQSASGRGLVANGSVIRAFAQIAPAGQIQHLELKHQFLARAVHNKSHLKNDLWAGLRTDKVTVMLCHWRRICREPERLRQCLKSCTPHENLAIKELVALYKDDPAQDGPEAVSPRTIGSLVSVPETQVAEPACTNRVLKVKVSEVSVDSDGFPAMLRSPKDSGKRLRKKDSKEDKYKAAAEASVPEPAAMSAERMLAIAELIKRAKMPTKKSKAKAKAKTKAKAKAAKAKAKAKAKCKGKKGELKTDRRNVYSRAYHGAEAEGTAKGLKDEELKEFARDAARNAVIGL